MTVVSPREEFAIVQIMNLLASTLPEDAVHDEKSACETLDLAAKMISCVMRKKMTAKTLQKKVAVLINRLDPERRPRKREDDA